MKNEDFAWLTEKKAEGDFAKDIVTDLLHKITELEHRVTGDVRSDLFVNQQPMQRGDTNSDVRSAAGASSVNRQSSVASFMKNRNPREFLKKLKAKKGAKF